MPAALNPLIRKRFDMKQIIQDLKNGGTILEEVPVPQVKKGYVLIRTTRSLVSLGTERMLVEFGRANLIDKARQQPDKVKQVLDKIKTDGLMPTLEAVFSKLGQPLPLGYCNVGTVAAIGDGVTEFQLGDRVASNGNHAEFVCVPKNLVAKIPDAVSDDEAAFTVIGAIALQGIRNLNPQLGETVTVIGLGLIGLLAAQLLRANGCRVIGIDFDAAKVELARTLGVTAFNPRQDGDPVALVLEATDKIGTDAVLITASASGDEIIHQACEMSRKRGRIVLIGVIGMNMRRDDFYKKELSFQVSCSYGAGRYDEEYENKGRDYPLPYVRWTEKRNFDAVLHAVAAGMIQVKPLISEVVPLESYLQIYGNMRRTGAIASLLRYPEAEPIVRTVAVTAPKATVPGGKIGIIGAGNFAASTIIPCLKKAGAPIKYVASAQGLNAKIMAVKANAELATSDDAAIFNDPEVTTVIACTRHDLHAAMVLAGLNAGKNVFVEKPLCLHPEELEAITQAQRVSSGAVTIGFNRRFSPFAVRMRQLSGNGAKNIVATINAGFIPPEMWVHDLEIGGGRIIGEACHFIDLCSFLADSPVTAVCMNVMGQERRENSDNATILLRYANGSNAVINYFANGSKTYAKERVELFAQNSVLVLDNWRRLTGYGVKGFRKMTGRQDKGHAEEFRQLAQHAINGGGALIPFEQLRNTTLTAFGCLESLRRGAWVQID